MIDLSYLKNGNKVFYFDCGVRLMTGEIFLNKEEENKEFIQIKTPLLNPQGECVMDILNSYPINILFSSKEEALLDAERLINLERSK